MVLTTSTLGSESDVAQSGENRGGLADAAASVAGDTLLAAIVGKNLRTHRLRRGLTLERLAKASGVSRAMLSRVELGRSMPTIKVVWKVARALDIPFSTLISDNRDSSCCVVRNRESKLLTSHNGRFRSRALFPIASPRRVEFYELLLAAGTTEQAHPHAPGTVENLVVTRGELDLTIERRREQLSVGDAIIFEADVPHTYVNRGKGDLIMYVVITYAERSL